MSDTDAALGRAVMERISELLRWERDWYRNRADWYAFTGLRQRNHAELRALLRLARQARRRPEPRFALTADRDDLLTSEDLDDAGNHYLFPEGVVEGEPAFNGSFR